MTPEIIALLTSTRLMQRNALLVILRVLEREAASSERQGREVALGTQLQILQTRQRLGVLDKE